LRKRTVATITVCGLLQLLVGGCSSATKKEQPASAATGSAATQPALAAPSSPKQQKPSRRLTISDPCPSRLHDLSGALLLYYVQNQRLPERIEELQRLPGGSIGGHVCPESKQPYVYNPKGVVGPNIVWRAVIYDAEPTHSGYRWVIAVQEPSGNAPLITDVFPWPESRFPKSPPAPPIAPPPGPAPATE